MTKLGMRVSCWPFLRPRNGLAGQRRPKCAVPTFDDHHAIFPAVKMVAIVFLESSDIAAIRIVKEESVSVVDHSRAGEKMPNRKSPTIVRGSQPSDHAILWLNQRLQMLRRTIGARWFGDGEYLFKSRGDRRCGLFL